MIYDDECPNCGGENICPDCGRCFTCEDNEFIRANKLEKLKGLVESIVDDIEIFSKPKSLKVLHDIKLLIKKL